MLKVGFYEKEITPPIGSDIPGYSGPRNSTTIHDPLFVKAASIRTGEAVHECVIMVVVDLINVPAKVYDTVMEKVERITGVPQKNIAVAATHTHTGGPIHDDGEFRVPNPAWMEMTAQSAADAAIVAFQRMQDATVRYACDKVEGLSFCRDFVMKNGEIRTNPKWHDPNIVKPAGKTDPEFPVLFFFDTEGNPMGAITNFACHHDSKAGTEISADYSGVLAAGMKDALGRNFVNILFQGACGNLNHCNPFREKQSYDIPNYQRIGKALLEAELRLYKEAVAFNIDEVLAEKRVLPLKKREIPVEKVEEAEWILKNVPNDWYQMDINKPENQMFKRTHAKTIIKLYHEDDMLPVYIQVIRMGDMSLYLFPGEYYVEFGLFIKENSPTPYNMVSGTSLKGPNGYIPTPELYNSTSYAVALGSAPLAPEAGQIMADFAVDLAKSMKE